MGNYVNIINFLFGAPGNSNGEVIMNEKRVVVHFVQRAAIILESFAVSAPSPIKTQRYSKGAPVCDISIYKFDTDTE